MFITGAFYTRFASEIESDPVGDYTRARMVMEELDIDPDEVTAEDYRWVRKYLLKFIKQISNIL